MAQELTHRSPLISRLPEIWRRLDPEGILARYLGLWDFELDFVHSKIVELISIRNLDNVPDRFLILLSPLVGHRWRDDQTRAWNRNRIRDSIRRHSYKGTLMQLGDLLREHGGAGFDLTDMASRLVVLGKNGRLGKTDAAIVSSDYWHDGAFDCVLDRRVDYEAFIEEFDYTKQGGFVWFFSLVYYLSMVNEESWSMARYTVHPDSNALLGTIGFGQLGIDLQVSDAPNGAVWRLHGGVTWHPVGVAQGIGFQTIGNDLFLSTEPSGDAWCEWFPVGWHPSSNILEGTIGYSPIGKEEIS